MLQQIKIFILLVIQGEGGKGVASADKIFILLVVRGKAGKGLLQQIKILFF